MSDNFLLRVSPKVFAQSPSTVHSFRNLNKYSGDTLAAGPHELGICLDPLGLVITHYSAATSAWTYSHIPVSGGSVTYTPFTGAFLPTSGGTMFGALNISAGTDINLSSLASSESRIKWDSDAFLDYDDGQNELQVIAPTINLSGNTWLEGYLQMQSNNIYFTNASGNTNVLVGSISSTGRTWTFPDKDGVVALTSDITGGGGSNYVPISGGTFEGDVVLSGQSSNAILYADTGGTVTTSADMYFIPSSTTLSTRAIDVREEIAFGGVGLNFSNLIERQNFHVSGLDIKSAVTITSSVGHFDTIYHFSTVGRTSPIFYLPANGASADGSKITVTDPDGNWGSVNLTINGNGKNIEGSSTVVKSTNYDHATFIFNSTSDQWLSI